MVIDDAADAELLALETQLAEAREKVASSADALSHQLAQVTDWREWIRREPALTLGLACCLGFALGRTSK